MSVPVHVCIIMDGNGRWAKKRMMPRTVGHKKGVETTRLAVEFFAKAGVRHLTLFAFSSENWNRPDEEVRGLMELFLQSLQKNTPELNDKGIRIRFIGDRSAFSDSLQSEICATEALTQGNKTMTLNVAANYGGQWDIVNAIKKIVHKLESGKLSAKAVNQPLLESELSLAGTPDPDLFIRTGGERRVSNFLIWQLAYTEFIFTNVLWPDFSEQEMQATLNEYASRQRRYGKTGDQIEAR
ncbi:MAG: di-trans,poly-cis-decaprenylcistransferase [Gammaproteobacteria bacterium]|nr:di-trans,poly-cis-decaprenylcistransferase [Gammaproteobacteria bacterium]